VKKSQASRPLRLDAQKLAPGGVDAARSGLVAAGAEDPPDRRRTDLVAEAGQFTVHAAVAPRGVLRRQPQRQVADVRASPRAARPARIGPLTSDQAAVPGQQGSRRDQSAAPQRGGQQPSQGCQDRAIGPVRPGTGYLAAQHHHLMAQHHHLMAQHQDLRVLGRLAAAQQDQPAEHPDRDQVQQTDRHERRACPTWPPTTNRSSAALRRVLEQLRHRVDWTSAGENIGEGGPVSDTSAAIAQMAVGLTQSMLNEKPPDDGHRLNILSSTFTHIGIAVYRDSSGTVWLTQDFSN
jgi:Cysteine-rich secretory protein family